MINLSNGCWCTKTQNSPIMSQLLSYALKLLKYHNTRLWYQTQRAQADGNGMEPKIKTLEKRQLNKSEERRGSRKKKRRKRSCQKSQWPKNLSINLPLPLNIKSFLIIIQSKISHLQLFPSLSYPWILALYTKKSFINSKANPHTTYVESYLPQLKWN